MVRKKMADLLREEVNKPIEIGAAVVQTEESAANGKGVETVEDADVQDADAAAIAHLSAQLDQAKQRETGLVQQIADLNTELEQQNNRVKGLQADLKKTESLKADLEQAKATALQLAETNASLNQELKTLRSATAPAKPTVPILEATTVAAIAPPQGLTQQELIRLRQAQTLAHPVFPNGTQPGHISNQDIGWVD